jgi:hypothetical protein
MTLRRWILPIATAASLGAAVASAGTGGAEPLRTGVLVETTSGTGQVAAARADVRALRERGVDAELRIARSPSEALAAAATLATRGATTLVTRGVSETAVLRPLARRHASLEIVRR